MIKKIRKIGMLVVGTIALCQAEQIHAADTNPPERMTYQGYLVDSNGVALAPDAPANYDVVFRIYDAKFGGTRLWVEQQTVTVDKGYFSVLLGEGSEYGSEPKGVFSSVFGGATASDRFIGITLGSGVDAVEIAPRLRLVASPYAFLASQARKLTDGSGNKNFFKDGTDLKLGAGATPTLKLAEGGKLTVDLTGYGVGLQIDNGDSSTTLGAESDSFFHFQTDLPGFYFNRDVIVNGAIRSNNQVMSIGDTNTYLKVDSGTKNIHAYTDNFYVRGVDEVLKVEIVEDRVAFRTDAEYFWMDKQLYVDGQLHVQDVGGMGGTINSGPINCKYMWIRAGTANGPFNIESDNTYFGIQTWNGVVHFKQRSHGQEKTSAHFGHDGVWRSNSDRRIKKNIIDYDDVLDRVMKLRVRSYDFIRSESNESEELGVVAQEVQPLFPDLVTAPHDGVPFNVESGIGGWSVSYSKFGLLGVKAVQELKQQTDTAVGSLRAENQALKAELAVLKGEHKTVESRLARLEELVSKFGQGQ